MKPISTLREREREKQRREEENTFYNSKHSSVYAFGEKTKAIIKEIM
jgi:hypothetical protein